jgi:hypothetical protein
MIYREKTKNLVAEYTSLSLAISKLLEKQEKNWGCFQVTKEGDFYSLNIPNLPSFKLYQNPKSIVYRGYWRQSQESFSATDTKNFPPDLWIKKKQKKVTIRKDSQNREEEKHILQLNSSEENKIQYLTKKQRIFEIVYRYNPTVEIRMINQLVADFLKEKITSNIISVPETEIFPLVLVAQPE